MSAIATALIVQSDVAGRAATTMQLYRSRTDVSDSFLTAALGAVGTVSVNGGRSSTANDTLAQMLAAFKIDVPKQNPSSGLYGVRKRAGRKALEIQRGDGDWVDLTDFKSDTPFEIQLPVPRET